MADRTKTSRIGRRCGLAVAEAVATPQGRGQGLDQLLLDKVYRGVQIGSLRCLATVFQEGGVTLID